MLRSLRVASAVLALSLLGGCPEGPRMEQWTPERDPHPPAVMTSAEARRAAEKEEDEGLAAALASSRASEMAGESELKLSDIGEGAGKAEPGSLIGVGPISVVRRAWRTRARPSSACGRPPRSCW